MTMVVGMAPRQAFHAAPNVRWWQRATVEQGLLPVIAVTGGKGKSTVVRMLDAMLNEAHLRTATWTNLGVEIRGKRQRGEIAGWSTALARLAESTVDVAIQELHWSTINAVGLPAHSYPLVAMANLVGGHDAPHEELSFEAARRGALRSAAAVHPTGTLVICGDDPAIVESARAASSTITMTSLSKASPNLRSHLDSGYSAIWVADRDIVSGDGDSRSTLCAVRSVRSGHLGIAQFNIANALTAAAIALTIGVDARTIAQALRTFEATTDTLPGSFNTAWVEGYRVVIDSACPSWHLRTLLRAANPGQRRRQITVLGNLEHLPSHDIREVGRLLGRHQGAIILHSNKDTSLLDSLRRGIAANDYPPIVIHLPTERRALNRALKTARPDDVVLMLFDGDPGPALRAVSRLSAAQSDPSDR